MKIHTIVVGTLETNCYLIEDEITKKAIIIDPGAEPEKILKKINQINLEPEAIINTHGHYDHIRANPILKDRISNLKTYIHSLDVSLLFSQDLPEADVLLEDGFSVSFGKINLKILHTPGHTEGSICIFMTENTIFTGDTLFCGGIGRCDLPGGDENKIFKSLKKIYSISNSLSNFFPGHGPACNLKTELKHNPFLNF